MKNKIQSDEYWDVDRDLRQDVRLMFSNCIEYNSEVPDILDYCEKFEKYANEILDKTEQTMRQKYRAQVEKKERKRRRSDAIGPPFKKKNKKRKKEEDVPSLIEDEMPLVIEKAPLPLKHDAPLLVKDEDQNEAAGNKIPYKPPSPEKDKKMKFTRIDDYVAVCDVELCLEKMSTKKKRQCDGTCCHSLQQLGTFCLMNVVDDFEFKGECPCRNGNVECSEECGCTTCCNRPIQNRCALKMGVDVREQETFGIDCYTRIQLVKLIEDSTVTQEQILTYIEQILHPAINDYPLFIKEHSEYSSSFPPDLEVDNGQAPFYINDVLKSLVYKFDNALIPPNGLYKNITNGLFSIFLLLKQGFPMKRARRIAWENWTSLVQSKNRAEVLSDHDICYRDYPIYCKGDGVICIRPEGIPANTFVIEFFGEVYPPYRWYEKEDRIRWVEKSCDIQDLNFHNVNLERHADDPDGYDVVVVDPALKGNYASRISHGCEPNCAMISTVVNGKYVLGIYTANHIHPGVELSFDYNAVTESEMEWKSSTCLCTYRRCRGFYLDYAGSSSFMEVVRAHHGLLQRVSMLLNASTIPLNEEEKERLKNAAIEESLLGDSPAWLTKFVANIVGFIDKEVELLPKHIMEAKSKNQGYEDFVEETAKTQAWGVRANRLTNVAITMDKIKHVILNKANVARKETPPLRMISVEQVVLNLWKREDSVMNSLVNCLRQHRIIVPEINKLLLRETPLNEEGLKVVRKSMIEAATILKTLPSTPNCKHHAASDLLNFYAHTEYWFSSEPFELITSPPLAEEHLGPRHYAVLKRHNKLSKVYQQQYVWGQCMYWMRQTIESPNSSLSAERRGTICLPDITSCYATSRTRRIAKLYDLQARTSLLEHLKAKSSSQWPTKWHWKFRWPMKNRFYGSPWFDAAYTNDDTKLKQLLAFLTTTDIKFPQ